MKKMKRIIPVMMAAVLVSASLPSAVKADSAKVVTLGANLSEEQKTSMYQYFGTTSDAVETIEVTNTDERQYMEGIATEQQIGTRTYSCSYVEPTGSGGIQVKVANLTFVTSSMIASTLTTSGVENCNVVAGSPIEVSGTGALTGIMMAYEEASGETLNEEQKETAVEELVTTGELADSIGKQEATDLMNEVKEKVIEDGLTDEKEIEDAVVDAQEDVNVTLSDEQKAKIVSLMQSISQYDYDVKALKKTLDNLDGKSEGFFSNLWGSIKGIFTGGSEDGGIINNTKDDILGAEAVIDSTIDGLKSDAGEDGEGFWDKIVGFFKNLFSGDDAEKVEDSSESEPTGEETEVPEAAEDIAPESSEDAVGDDVAADTAADDAGNDAADTVEGQGETPDEGNTEIN